MAYCWRYCSRRCTGRNRVLNMADCPRQNGNRVVMSRAKLVGMLVTPSPLSALVCLVAAAIVLAVGAWAHVSSSQSLYGHAVDSQVLVAVIQNLSALPGMVSSLFVGTTIYNAFVILCSVLAGITVYFLLMTGYRLYTQATTSWHTFLHADPITRHILESEIWAHVGVRLITATLWVVYLFVFLQFILPLGTSVMAASLDNMQPTLQWMYFVAGYCVLALGMHGHVVFARLVSLRPRLFS